MSLSKCCLIGWVVAIQLLAQPIPEDPVLKARSQRAAAQGMAEGDLPPVPRSIMEPPPLPPPETHRKDLRGYRATKQTKIAKRKAPKKGTAKAKSTRKRSRR